MAGNGDKIIALDTKRMTAMSKGDVGTLNALIADELVYTHSSARLDTKQSLIENMQIGQDRVHRRRAVQRQGAGLRRYGRPYRRSRGSASIRAATRRISASALPMSGPTRAATGRWSPGNRPSCPSSGRLRRARDHHSRERNRCRRPTKAACI